MTLADLQLLLPPVPDHGVEVQHPPALAQPALPGQDEILSPLLLTCTASTKPWGQPRWKHHVIGSNLAVGDYVLTMGNLILMQL